MKTPKPVLYVEDDENDVFLMERAFKKLEITNPLRVATDGKAAINSLGSALPGEDENAPCLVLLDLSMPCKNGLEVLKWIRNKPSLSALPVIVLTSSNQENDIHRAFQLRANGFISKPGDSNKLLSIVKAIKQYWLSESRPPEPFAEFAATANVPVISRAPINNNSPNRPTI